MTATRSFTIRPLGLLGPTTGDRRRTTSLPDPWSLAMFVLELSKPSGVCLAAVEDSKLLGYLICSRYDQVWHLMNIAVDPPARRRGVATALLTEMLARGGTDQDVHARGADFQCAGDRTVRALRFPLGGDPAALLPGHRRGRRDHVAHR